ncbi:MAG: Ig-like domain-containing protein [Muribaculaceae bacterium]|nr:Ig-like domain-containing protein [Muribaculaceae bacterium]
MNKKYLIAILLLLTLIAPFGASADRFFVNPVNFELGKTETIRFILENTQDYYGFQTEVRLPEGLDALKGSDGELDITLSNRAADGDFIVNSNVLPDGTLIMGAFSSNHKPFSGNEGVLVDLKVSVAESFKGGSIEISDIYFINNQNEDVEFDSTSSEIGVMATGISLSETEISINEGESKTLTAIITPESATDKSVTWKSSDEAVATVSAEGVVTGVKIGTATITAATSNGTIATCEVKVTHNDIEVSDIKLSHIELTLIESETATLTVTITPENASDKSVTWTTSNSAVATVSAEGVVTAVKPGTATITAASSNGKTAVCVVTVKPTVTEVADITLSETELNLIEGETATLTATVTPDDATDKSVSWTSFDIDVATVSAEGVVTAVKAGTAIIYAASTNGKTATCMVTVTAKVIEVSDVMLNATELRLTEGETAVLTATVAPDDAADKTVTWRSSEPAVATVSAEGVVTAVKAGTATITAASSNGKTATCTVTVAAKPIEVIDITISEPELSLTEGETATLTVTITPENAADKTVTWTSSDATVATVSADGIVTAVKAGDTTITATSSNGKIATCKVTVAPLPVLAESLTIDPTEWKCEDGKEFTIVATVLPENTTDKTVAYESSDLSIAVVDAEGHVEILKDGICIITVSTVDGSDLKAECVITKTSGIDTMFADPKAEVDVFDMNGVLLKRSCTSEQLKQLRPAVYILRNGDAVGKIVIR